MSQRSWSDCSGFPEASVEQDSMGPTPVPTSAALARRYLKLQRASLSRAEKVLARRTLMSFKSPVFMDTRTPDTGQAKALTESQATVYLQGHNLRMF
eukprot:1975986-Pyramimonas_sp.AAC.1